jgi:hypothetical protein
VTIESFSTLATVFLSLLGGAVYLENRLTKIETLLKNHLAHHDSFEKLILRFVRPPRKRSK